VRSWVRTHFKKPSPAMATAFLALMIALGGTAIAATATIVNIADPTTPANKASVDARGHLVVGDGSGALSVDGVVIAQAAAPNTIFHSGHNVGGEGNAGCITIATPPAGKALIVREVRVNVYKNPKPGSSKITITRGKGCGDALAGDVSPPTVGQTVVPFDPGYIVPYTSVLSAYTGGQLEANLYVDAYTVAASAVPAG